MSRVNPLPDKPSTPQERILCWRGDGFSVWDEEKHQNTRVSLPLKKLIFLEHYTCIRGYHEPTDSGIYSNVIYSTLKEVLYVRNSQKMLARGYYSMIKDQIKQLGGQYTKQVYCYCEGEIIVLLFKGRALQEYFLFMKENESLLKNHYFEVPEALESSKGSIVFHVPIFTVGKKINEIEDIAANEAAQKVGEYFKNASLYYQERERTAGSSRVIDADSEDEFNTHQYVESLAKLNGQEPENHLPSNKEEEYPF